MSDADVSTLDQELKLNGRAGRDGWVASARGLVEAG